MSVTTIEKVNLSDQEREAFTYGDCWLLARALNNICGWQMVGIGSEGGCYRGAERDWIHLLVRTPYGHLLDVEGLHEESEMDVRWGPDLWLLSTEGGEMDIFDVSLRDWHLLTNAQRIRYPDISPVRTARKLLHAYRDVLD